MQSLTNRKQNDPWWNALYQSVTRFWIKKAKSEK